MTKAKNIKDMNKNKNIKKIENINKIEDMNKIKYKKWCVFFRNIKCSSVFMCGENSHLCRDCCYKHKNAILK